MENLYRPVTVRNDESVIKKKKSQQRKVQDQMASLMNFTKQLKQNEHQSFSNSPTKIEVEFILLLNSFYKDSFPLISKPGKGIIRKLQANMPYEHRFKQFQQNTCKQIYQHIKKTTISEIYPRNARVVYIRKLINVINTVY